MPLKESLSKTAVDGVLAVIASELRAIVKKDIYRRMIELVAFKAFDYWWDDKEQAAKVGFIFLLVFDKIQRSLRTFQN